jgi:hypothetical protein
MLVERVRLTGEYSLERELWCWEEVMLVYRADFVEMQREVSRLRLLPCLWWAYKSRN